MKVSVVIPALNEAQRIQTCLGALGPRGEDEWLVIDGGSRDETVAFAERGGAKVVQTHPGIAHQCNLGAQLACHEVLLFLAADSAPLPGWRPALERALQDSEVSVGGFSLEIGDPSWVLSVISWASNVRARQMQFALLDQGLFIRKSAFHPFDETSRIPFIDQSWGASGFCLLPEKVRTSARKWREHGIALTTGDHVLQLGRYLLSRASFLAIKSRD